MEQLSFIESFRTSPFILTEGAIVERLRHEFHISPDKHIAHAALIYDDSHREILASIYRQYLQIATEFRLPLMLMTPTRRANIEQIAASDYRHKNVLADTMAFPQTKVFQVRGIRELRGVVETPHSDCKTNGSAKFTSDLPVFGCVRNTEVFSDTFAIIAKVVVGE